MEAVNARLTGRKRITAYDIQAVRKVHGIDAKPQFYYKSKFASPQYSEAFVDWLVEAFERDNAVFEAAKAAYRRR